MLEGEGQPIDKFPLRGGSCKSPTLTSQGDSSDGTYGDSFIDSVILVEELGNCDYLTSLIVTD